MEKVKNAGEIYKRLSQPPAWALKTIEYGSMKGKTQINPQWRAMAMTEEFGLCGEGWWYDIVRVWPEQSPNGEVMAFVEIKLYIKDCAAGIPAIGGSKIVELGKGELRSNDEGYKMATTDAIGKAMSLLGVAGDIYMNLWDGSKYREHPEHTTPQAVKPTHPPAGNLSETEWKMKLKPYLDKMVRYPNHQGYAKLLLEKYGVQSSKDIKPSEVDAFIGDVVKWMEVNKTQGDQNATATV